MAPCAEAPHPVGFILSVGFYLSLASTFPAHYYPLHGLLSLLRVITLISVSLVTSSVSIVFIVIVIIVVIVGADYLSQLNYTQANRMLLATNLLVGLFVISSCLWHLLLCSCTVTASTKPAAFKQITLTCRFQIPH